MFIFLLLFMTFFGFYYYQSYQIILLNDLKEIFQQTASKAQADLKGHVELVLEDLGKSYSNILIIIAITAVLSFVWILLLKYNAKIIIWLSIFSLPVIFSIGAYYSILNYINLHNGEDSLFIAEGDDQQQTLAFDKALQTILTAELLSYVRNETLWLVLSIILCLVLAISVILLHSLRERVSLSIALIRQASKAINGVKTTLIFPLIPRAFGIAVLIYGIMISLLIISASHPTFHIEGGPLQGRPCYPRTFNKTLALINNAPQQQTNSTSSLKPKCVMSQTLARQHVWKYHALNLFATIWMIQFISGVNQTTLAGAFASYYWAYRKPRDVPFFAVTMSFYRVVRYHLGDIAFGSFLIATIRYIRVIIEFIDHKIRRKDDNSTNAGARSVTCFLRVFFWLLDRFLKYIDRNAYIMMSMYGEGYLSSAKRAVGVLYDNSTRAIVLDYVTYFVLLVSRLLITGIAGYITAQQASTADLHYKWLPILLVVLGAYFISKGLFSVYSMAVNTLFICFLIDSSSNDGSAERPYFMSKELRKIIKRNTVRN